MDFLKQKTEIGLKNVKEVKELTAHSALSALVTVARPVNHSILTWHIIQFIMVTVHLQIKNSHGRRILMAG